MAALLIIAMQVKASNMRYKYANFGFETQKELDEAMTKVTRMLMISNFLVI